MASMPALRSYLPDLTLSQRSLTLQSINNCNCLRNNAQANAATNNVRGFVLKRLRPLRPRGRDFSARPKAFLDFANFAHYSDIILLIIV